MTTTNTTTAAASTFLAAEKPKAKREPKARRERRALVEAARAAGGDVSGDSFNVGDDLAAPSHRRLDANAIESVRLSNPGVGVIACWNPCGKESRIVALFADEEAAGVFMAAWRAEYGEILRLEILPIA